jgi:hypothetical protein
MNPNVHSDPTMYDEFGQPKKQGFMAKIKTKLAGWKEKRKEKKLRKQARKEGDISSSPSPSPEREPGYTSPTFGKVGGNPITHAPLATPIVASEVFPQSSLQHSELNDTFGAHQMSAGDLQMMEAPPTLPGLGQAQFTGLTTEQVLAQQTLTQQPLSTEQLIALQPQSFISQLPPQTLSYSQPSSLGGFPISTNSSGLPSSTYVQQQLLPAMQQSPMASQGKAMTMEQFQELTGIPMDQIKGLPLQTGATDLTGLEVAQESQPAFGNIQAGSSHPQVQQTIIRSNEQILNANTTSKLPEFI